MSTAMIHTLPTPLSTSPLAESSDAEILDTLEHSERALRLSRADLLIAIEQFHSRNLAPDHGSSTTVQWLVRTLDINIKTAYEYVSVSTRLVQFPLLLHQVRAGNISYSKLRFLLKYITQDNEAELVELALKLGLAGLEHALAGHERSTEDAPEPESFTIHERDDGGIKGYFSLNATFGASLFAALKIGESSFRSENADDDDAEHTPSRFGITPARALLSALQGMINIVRHNPGGAKRAPGAQVNVVMTTDGHAFLPFQPKATSRSLKNIAGNAVHQVHILDDKGLTLHVSRKTRFVSEAQLQALLVRWGHRCATPGCNHTNWIEIHHLLEWIEGGETSLENLIPLCSRCHALVTQGIIKVVPNGDDIFFIFQDDTCYISRNRATPELTTMEEYLSRQATPYDNADSFDDPYFDDMEWGGPAG